MKLSFIGADHKVTGSFHLLEACGLNIAIDCGMEQGKIVYENAAMPVKYSDLDYILLTHAHIDHAGMIPYAVKNGFNGSILCTSATAALAEIMLRDSAHIQMQEAEWRNRKGKRLGRPEVVPLYDLNDTHAALELFRGFSYGEEVELADGVHIRFVDAGHLLGSASIELFLNDGSVQKKLVFSGDIGNIDKPLIRDPEYIEEADYVIMESTYGDRLHETDADHIKDLVEITQRTLDRGGNVVLPAFAVGRTQELLYLYREIKQRGLIHGHDGFPVYVDSPLAVEATHVFTRELKQCYDDETRELVEKGINPISFRGLRLSITSDESKLINLDQTPKVIISASGMCDAGRIRHHIKHNVWRRESTIVFAGYQAEGTLGRILMDGAEKVKLFGEEIAVSAEIASMKAMSSHADQAGLMQWITAYKKAPDRVFLVHGNDDAMETLAGLINERLGCPVDAPYSGSCFDLVTNSWISSAKPVPFVKESPAGISGLMGISEELLPAGRRRSSDSAYERLVAAYQKLMTAVKANYGGSNKDLAKFTDQLLSLYDKWIR